MSLGAIAEEQLAATARRIRERVVKMITAANASHVGSSLSAVDILAVLYFHTLLVDPSRPDWPERDRFVMSKGHACAALYATLGERGFLSEELLNGYCRDGALLAGHVVHRGVPGIEVSSGALGHGLSLGSGFALAAKRDGRRCRTYVLLSDGECDEGSTWEAALFAPHHRLDNLVAIVDYNKIQSLGHVNQVLDLEPLGAKWAAARWAVREIDGHDLDQIQQALSQVPFEPGKPSCLIAHTVKGKGVSFMEDKLLWHYRSPQGEEYESAIRELEAQA